jgi:hypothetical protein
MTIPRDVKESLLIKLFQADNGETGSFQSQDSPTDTSKCARVVPCRNSAKGKRLCREWLSSFIILLVFNPL